MTRVLLGAINGGLGWVLVMAAWNAPTVEWISAPPTPWEIVLMAGLGLWLFVSGIVLCQDGWARIFRR